jgi:hypothetical protein
MDPIQTPNSPGAGSPPLEFAGRDKIREQVRVANARIRVGNAAKSVFMALCCVASVVLLTGCVHRPPLKPYVGSWVLNANRTGDDTRGTYPIMTLQLTEHHHTLKGQLVCPIHMTEEPDGSFHDLELPMETRNIDGVRFNRPLFDIRFQHESSTEHAPLMLIDADHLVLGGFPGAVPPWRFERVKTLPNLEVFKNK